MIPSGEIRSLSTVRGVAALMVAVYHAGYLFEGTFSLPHAYLAVDLFFVLSGFVMLHAYGPRIEGGMSLGRFAQLRLARLYPLVAIATLAGFAVWATRLGLGRVEFRPQALTALPLNLLLLPAPAEADPNHAAYPFAMQSWSILWEVLLSLMLLAWLRWVRRGAVLIALFAGVALAVVGASRNTLDGGWTTDTFWIGALRALFAFWAGVVVRQATAKARASRRLNLAALIAGGGALFYVWRVHPTFWWADYAAVTVAFPLILAACALTRSRWLENRLGDVLGQASYSVYLLHLVTLQMLFLVFGVWWPIPGPVHFAMGMVWLVALTGLSWLSWRYLETPLRVWFSRPLVLRRAALA